MLQAGETIYSYVAIRSDEEYREGYSSKHDKLIVKTALQGSRHRQARRSGYS